MAKKKKGPKWLDLSMEDYGELPGVRGSDMNNYSAGGLALVHHVRQFGLADTKSFLMGRALHDELEGKFKERWAVFYGRSRVSRVYKAFRAEATREVILAHERDDVFAAAEELRFNTVVRDLLEMDGLIFEPCIQVQVFGGLVKVRPDAFGRSTKPIGERGEIPEGSLISVNWKSVGTNVQLADFGRKFRYMYLNSAGLYAEAYDTLFVDPVYQVYPVVSFQKPHQVRVFVLGEELELVGRQEASIAIAAIHEADQSGHWREPDILETIK